MHQLAFFGAALAVLKFLGSLNGLLYTLDDNNQESLHFEQVSCWGANMRELCVFASKICRPDALMELELSYSYSWGIFRRRPWGGAARQMALGTSDTAADSEWAIRPGAAPDCRSLRANRWSSGMLVNGAREFGYGR